MRLTTNLLAALTLSLILMGCSTAEQKQEGAGPLSPATTQAITEAVHTANGSGIPWAGSITGIIAAVGASILTVDRVLAAATKKNGAGTPPKA